MKKRPSKASLKELPELDFTKVKIIGRGTFAGAGRLPAMPLGMIRKSSGKTQVEVTEKTGMDQGDISRLERKEDALVSTLRRYIEALGGELELVAVFKTGHRIRVDL